VREQLRNDRTVREHDDELVHVPGGDALDRSDDARDEHVARLCTGNDIPPLLRHHLDRDRVSFGHVLAEHAAFPLAEQHFAEVRLDHRFDAESGRERCGRLDRALQGRDVDRRDVLAREPLGDPLCLVVTDRVEGRVAMPVHQCELSTDPVRGRRAVAHEQQLRCAGRRRERSLRVFGLVLRHGS
jgi:hypothetical protein